MENNFVRLTGKVKRGAESKAGRLIFTVEVLDESGEKMWFDCLCTSRSDAFEDFDGFVNEGEPIEVVGHLVKYVTIDHGRVGNTRVQCKTTNVFVYVDEVITED